MVLRIKINEKREDTLKFIESKRNPDAEICKAKLTECKIYARGQYYIVEHDSIIHYWELDGEYNYLKKAIGFMQLYHPKKYKTIDKLISLRMAIRQTEVNLCSFIDELLVGNRMTLSLYENFMRLARVQDLAHHGQHTF